MRRCKIHLVAGTRPNVMKIAPLYKTLKQQAWCDPRIFFLEQHDTANMGAGIFKQLNVDDVTRLTLMKGDLGTRLGSIISVYDEALRADDPDLVVIPGDVDVSLGTAIAAKRALRPVAHLEAGLRSTDRRMPEELNRILIDSIADILLAPSEAAAENLVFGEGQPRDKVHFVGNIMIDSLKEVLALRQAGEILRRFALTPKKFAVVTFHRPSNVDDPVNLERVVQTICDLARDRKVVFPVHPRTISKLSGQQRKIMESHPKIRLVEPMAYPDFVNLISQAELVVTDSGGVQEETTYVGTPCLTLRETTERPVTTILGTNILVSFDDVAVHASCVAERDWTRQPIPLWDGETAWRCAHVFNTWWRNQERLR